MYILGIETSCDETSASVVLNGRKILSLVTSTSLNAHKRFGGIVPEIAFRAQLETIVAAVAEALRQAGIKKEQVHLISVTSHPGLMGSLLVGVSFAKSLSLALQKPLLGVDHLVSHISSCFLAQPDLKYPFVSLVVSGGHTSLYRMRDIHRRETLGETLDDACGEAFDKVAKLLGLGYPGGPAIEKVASRGNPKKIHFRCSKTKRPLDFSFSGIKTAVMYYIRDKNLSLPQVRDIAASFQESVIDTLAEKSLLACRTNKIKTLCVSGGVAANETLQAKFNQFSSRYGVSVIFPPKNLCTDNAAMVAAAGYSLFKKGLRCDLRLNPFAS